MGLFTKLAGKAEKLALQALDKASAAAAAQGGGGAGGSGGAGGYAAPTVYQNQYPTQHQQQQPQYPTTQQQQPQANYPSFGPPAGFGQAPPKQGFGQAPPQQGGPPPGAPEYLAPTTYSPNLAGQQQGRKKAVLVGVSYVGTRSMLRGTLNDVQCIKFCLINRFGFHESNIVTLRDDVRHPDFYPTRANIMRACQWLMTDLQFGDSLFFQFSGHGSQMRDPTGMEDDGYDETILPVDHSTAGQIRDTELHRMLCAPLPQGVVLHGLFDSCHSGTVLDLPYTAKYDKSGAAYWEQSRMYGTAGGTAFQLGACSDGQTAADTSAMSKQAYTGAATYSFIDSIERYGVDQTYANLLLHMTESLRRLGKTSQNKPNGAMGAMTSMAPMLGALAGGAAGLMAGALLGNAASMSSMSHQLPTLACDKPVDIHQIQLMI
ncbi:MAG: type I metacaspase [Monoraphidium minutum]|nr:MAG: type I metacaspase [Monoraphidium minutum]